MNKMKILCALLLIVTLSACSSGGGGGSSKAKSGFSGDGGPVVPVPFTLPTILSDAPGINSYPVETTNTLLSIEAAFAEIKTAIGLPSTDVGSLATATPTGRATLNGYIRIPGKVATEIIVGNLEIKFDLLFPDSVTTKATNLAEFDISGPDGPVPLSGPNVIDPNRETNLLQGSGTITGTTIESNSGGFGGNLFNQAVNYQVSVEANLNGDFYNDDDGTLITYGTVTGTTTTSTGTSNAFDDGVFAASEE